RRGSAYHRHGLERICERGPRSIERKDADADRLRRTKPVGSRNDAAIRIPLLLCWTRKHKAAVTKYGAAFCSPNRASGLAALAKRKMFRGFHCLKAPCRDGSHSFRSWVCLGTVLWRFAQFNAARFL